MNSFVTQIPWIEENFTEIKTSTEVALDLKYATSDNFMKENVYEGFNRCFLAPLAAERFFKACADLKTQRPDLQFIIWDALRPRHVQEKFFNHLKGGPFETYVAAPDPGSLHNFGMAMDLSLQTKEGSLLDMGTGFDDFRDLAQPRMEKKFLLDGILTHAQFKNRMLLRSLLETHGFRVLEHEWWHFNALPKEEVLGKYPRLD